VDISLWTVPLLMVFGFTSTLALIPLAKRWAPIWNLVSQPEGRRNHAQETPLTGGWTLFVPLAVAFLAFMGVALTGKLTVVCPKWPRVLSLFLGTTWILILGTIDDHKVIGWKQKLAGQFLGGLILVLGGHTVTVATIPWVGLVHFGWYGIPFFLLAVTTVTNAINLIDGLDGLAGGICFFAALTCAIIALVKGDFFTVVLGFTLSGSLLGFLLFNFPPASIFLGDAGSMMLGFLLGTLAISSTAIYPGQRLGTSIMILVPFLPLGIPLFEVALSIMRRWLTGKALFLGDGNHLHHRLMGKIKAPRPTVAVFYFFSASLCILTLLIVLEVHSPILRFLTGLLTLSLMVAVTWCLLSFYGNRSLFLILKNRSHFKFLGTFLSFMQIRISRAGSLEELVDLLGCGVRDLGFDRVTVAYDSRILKQWINPGPGHSGNPRITSEDTLADWGLKVSWDQPQHDDASYNEYLMLTWHRLLTSVRKALVQHPLQTPDVENFLQRLSHMVDNAPLNV
jgi:UDP-GlcNAc:undecaprenyl-phosphate GlcNAc-1-phosphate transferase